MNFLLPFSVIETDWSIQMANDIVTNDWVCANCSETFHITGMQKLQHQKGKKTNVFASERHTIFNNLLNLFLVCKPIEIEPKIDEEAASSSSHRRPHGSKEFKCSECRKTLYLSSIDILKHRKTCRRKETK